MASSPTTPLTATPTPTHRSSNVSNGLCGDKNIYLCHPGIIVGVIAAIVIGSTALIYLGWVCIRNKGDWKGDLAWNLRKSRKFSPFPSSRRRPRDKGKATIDNVKADVEMAPASSGGGTIGSRDDITATMKVGTITEDDEPQATAATAHHVRFGEPH